MWRRLLAFRSRIRDLGLLILVAQHIWAGLSGWLTLGAGIAFAAFVTTVMATAATTNSKAVATENRLNAYITQTNTTVDSQDARISSLEAGTFSNVPGAGTVTMTAAAAGPYSLHVGALANFTSGPNTQFLAGLQKLNHLSGQPTDNNSGSTWASGERGYINNCVNWINSIDGDLQSKGWMN